MHQGSGTTTTKHQKPGTPKNRISFFHSPRGKSPAFSKMLGQDVTIPSFSFFLFPAALSAS